MIVDSALFFWAMTTGYLSTDAILLCLLYRADRQHQQLRKEVAATQQASSTRHSVSYLEGLARAARGEGDKLDENDADVVKP